MKDPTQSYVAPKPVTVDKGIFAIKECCVSDKAAPGDTIPHPRDSVPPRPSFSPRNTFLASPRSLKKSEIHNDINASGDFSTVLVKLEMLDVIAQRMDSFDSRQTLVEMHLDAVRHEIAENRRDTASLPGKIIEKIMAADDSTGAFDLAVHNAVVPNVASGTAGHPSRHPSRAPSGVMTPLRAPCHVDVIPGVELDLDGSPFGLRTPAGGKTTQSRSSQKNKIFKRQSSVWTTTDHGKVNVQGLALVKGWTKQEDTLGSKGWSGTELLPDAVQIKNTYRWIIRSSWFENFCVMLIVTNTIFLGYQVQYMAVNIGSEPPESLIIAHSFFTFFFLVELLARISVGPREWATGEGWSWNWFDFVVVVASIMELVLNSMAALDSGAGQNLSLFRVLRILRIVRVVRFIRVFRFFRELRMMVSSIMGSMKSLVWAISLLFVLLLIVAMYLTQMVTDYRTGSDSDANLVADLEKIFGSLFGGMYYLFLSMTGGISWGEVSGPLIRLHWGYGIFFCLFTSFILFAVLNIVTGVFVEGAIGKAQSEKDEKIRRVMEEEMANVHALENIFKEIDVDMSGQIDLEEFEILLKDKRIRAYFQTIGLHVQEAHGLFRLLDLDNSNTVSISEFIMGCVRLKGEAKGVDLATLMYENKRMMMKWSRFMYFVEDQFDQMKGEVDRLCNNVGRLGNFSPEGGAGRGNVTQNAGSKSELHRLLSAHGSAAWSPRRKDDA